MKISFLIVTVLITLAFVSAKEDDKVKCEDIISAKSCVAMEKLGKTLQTSIGNVNRIIRNAVIKGTGKVSLIYKRLLMRLKRASIGSPDQNKIAEVKKLMDKIIEDILKEYKNADSKMRKLIGRAVLNSHFKRKGMGVAVKNFLEKISGEKDDNVEDNLETRYRRTVDEQMKSILSMVRLYGKAALAKLLNAVSSGLGHFKTYLEDYLKKMEGSRTIRSEDDEDRIADEEAQNEINAIVDEAEFEVELSIESTVGESEKEIEEISNALGHEISRRDLADDIILKKFEFFLGIFGAIAGPQLHSIANQLFQTHRQEIIAGVKGGFFAMLRLVPKLLPLIG